MSEPVRIGLIGFGRMGAAIFEDTLSRTDSEITRIKRKSEGVKTTFDPALFVEKMDDLFTAPDVDVVLDVSQPAAFPAIIAHAVRAQKPIVSCVTGLSPDDLALLEDAATVVPVLYASNTSLSLVVMRHNVREMARLLAGRGYDCHIHEVHHRKKVDAPSGTAKTLGQEVVAGSGGQITPAYSSARGGTVIGIHVVTFYGDRQSLSLQHNVEARSVFATGAVDAAVWLARQPKGLYMMDHVLGLAQEAP